MLGSDLLSTRFPDRLRSVGPVADCRTDVKVLLPGWSDVLRSPLTTSCMLVDRCGVGVLGSEARALCNRAHTRKLFSLTDATR